MAAAGVFSDRACIASDGAINFAFSPQHLVDCQNSSYGCQGGHPPLSWNDMMKYGIVSDNVVLSLVLMKSAVLICVQTRRPSLNIIMPSLLIHRSLLSVGLKT